MKKYIDTDAGSRPIKHDRALSPKFWQLVHALEAGWDMMNELLEREWQILKSRSIAQLWSLGREKEMLASQLQALEKRMDLEIPGLDIRHAYPAARWKSIMAASSSHEETARLVSWKAGLAHRKKMAFETNRRLWVWISEQQEMARSMAAILSGRKDDSVTYGAARNHTIDTARTEYARVTRSSMSGVAAGQDMHFFSSFSREKIDHVMRAYAMAESDSGRA